jgi:16S rRNA (cytidine1402-2'-O)-methyltransferase
MTGNLYLIPTTLGEFDTAVKVLPDYNNTIIHQLSFFIVENVRTARRFLAKTRHPVPIDEMEFFELGKHTPEEQIASYLKPLKSGISIGLLSEAGTPCIADPGSVIVKMAHELNFDVIPLVGPNSIILALMGSGMNGQQFSFHGYLPVGKNELTVKLKELEKLARNRNQTQIFIETPFRNRQLFESILNSCRTDTLLCIATDITLPSESIKTKRIGSWIKQKVDLHKRPTVFLISG